MNQIIRRYIASFDTARPISTLLRLFGEDQLMIALAYTSVITLGPSGPEAGEIDHRYDILNAHPFLLTVLLLPLIETLFMQLLVCEVARKCTRRVWVPFIASWLLFAAVHFLNSFGSGVVAGLVGGFYLALTYTLFRPKSIWWALGGTFFLHAACNFIQVIFN
jgi:hypothetical protein